MYFGLPVNVSVSLDVCLSAGFFTQTGRKMERFQSAASGYKPRLDPFGFPCWLSEMSKIQDWICLKHNAVKPQSRFFCCCFFIVVFKEVEDMEVRERRERRAQQCLDVKDGTASQRCQKAKAVVDPSPGRSKLYNCES